MKQTPMKTLLSAILTPILMLLFLMAEPSFALHEYGVTSLVGLVFLGSLIVSTISSIHFGRNRRDLVLSVAIIFMLASGPFWGDVLGLQPNVHGFSILFWFVYVLVAWVLVVYLIVAAGWHEFKARSATRSG